MRLGVIADAHLSPPGTRVSAFHTGYESPYTAAAYRLALRRCAKEDVDGVVLLGDLSQAGDDKSLETGVRLAAEVGRRAWIVPGNHDCFERIDALEAVVRRVAADNIRLVSSAGEVIEGELRVAGLCITSGSGGYKARSNGGRGAEDWGDEPAVWLSHYPMVSFAEEVTQASLIYGLISKTWKRSRGRCSRGRHRPLLSAGTYTCGTLARRGRCFSFRARRSSSRRSRSRS